MIWDVLGVIGILSLLGGVFFLAGGSWALMFAGAVLLIVAIIGAKNGIPANRA